MKKLVLFIVILSSVYFIRHLAINYNTNISKKSQGQRCLHPHGKSPTKILPIKISITTGKPQFKMTLNSSFINHLLGKFDYRKDSGFIAVESKYCSKPMYLQKETFQKFKEMHEAAKKDGVTLIIISGTRNFIEQKGIWEGKWVKFITSMDSLTAAKKILLYSSMPTTSRHHWGTDIDINSLDNHYFTSGKGLKEYEWLKKNASKFGFCQVYTDKTASKRTGYEMEKWHWSYLPISSQYLKKYNELVSYKDITGFTGSYLAPKLRAIEDYVNGIEAICQ